MRTELERRPLLFLLSGLIIGISANLNSFNLSLLPLIFIVGRPVRARLYLASAFVLGLLLAPQDITLTHKDFVRARAHVDSRSHESSTGWTATGTLDGVRVLLVGQKSAPQEGQEIEFSGTASAMTPRQNRLAVIKVENYSVVEEAPLPVSLAQAWYGSVEGFLKSTSLNGEDGHFLLAMCFGRDVLDREELSEARQTGWIRLMSASGLQVLTLVALLEACSKLVPIPRPALIALMIAVLLVYAIASGHHASTERAILIVLTSRCAYLFQKRADLLSSLALAAIAILIFDPNELFSLGFQVTCVVVAAIALFGGHPKTVGRTLQERIFGVWIGAMRSCLILSLAGLPLIAQTLHEVSLQGVLASLAVVALVPFLIGVTLLSHAISLFLPSAGCALIDLLMAPAVEGMGVLFDSVARLGVAWSVPEFSGYVLLVYYAAWLTLWRKSARPS